MIPYEIDVILRIGRLLGTVRSLIIQSKDLLDFLGYNATDLLDEDIGHEF